MRWISLLLRILGWLLTPLVVWAASLIGAAIAMALLSPAQSSRAILYLTIAVGMLTGLVSTLLWMSFLRSSPRLRKSLHITPEGLPELEPEPEPPPAVPPATSESAE
jgi:hypothetical protein